MAGRCDWCGREGTLNTLENLGEKFQVCNECAKLASDGVCRKCGSPLGTVSFYGVCMACYEEVINNKYKKQEAEMNGSENLDILLQNEAGLTRSDYEAWLLTTGQGYFTPEHRRNVRIAWLNKKLTRIHMVVAGSNGKRLQLWDSELINSHFNDIEKMLDKPDMTMSLFRKMYRESSRAVVLLDRVIKNGRVYELSGLNKLPNLDDVNIEGHVCIFNMDYYGTGPKQIKYIDKGPAGRNRK